MGRGGVLCRHVKLGAPAAAEWQCLVIVSGDGIRALRIKSSGSNAEEAHDSKVDGR